MTKRESVISALREEISKLETADESLVVLEKLLASVQNALRSGVLPSREINNKLLTDIIQLSQTISLDSTSDQVATLASTISNDIKVLISNFISNESTNILESYVALVNKTRHIDDLINQSTQSLDEISKKLLISETEVSKINECLTIAIQSSKNCVAELDEIYGHKLDTKSLLEDTKKSLTNVKKYEANASAVYKDVRKSKNAVEDAYVKFAELSTQAEQNYKKALLFSTEQKTRIDDLTAKATNILGKATNASLGRHWIAKRDRAKSQMRLWGGLLILPVILALSFLLVAAYPALLPDEYKDSNFLFLKLSSTPILAFMIWFCTAQFISYKREKEACDDKQVLVVSLDDYKDFLEGLADRWGLEKEEAFKLILNTIRRVYDQETDAELKNPPQVPKIPF